MTIETMKFRVGEGRAVALADWPTRIDPLERHLHRIGTRMALAD